MAVVELSRAHWAALEEAHEARVEAALAGHLGRRSRGEKHPVEDFLHTYYSFSPGQLRRWHPGAGVVLAGATGMPRADWRFYTRHGEGEGDGVRLHLEAFLAERRDTIAFTRSLLAATAARPAQLGCFGLHEWAMVYRQPQEQVRHRAWPLRLGTDGTAQVVEAHQLRCTHVDAFRFFTPDAVPRNLFHPTRSSQVAMEQPGCLHAGMDLYKWCYKLTPLVPSELTMDAFDLAREIRLLDMEASPYDLSNLGITPVPIETPQGKATYVARQREFATRANELRSRLLTVLEPAQMSG